MAFQDGERGHGGEGARRKGRETPQEAENKPMALGSNPAPLLHQNRLCSLMPLESSLHCENQGQGEGKSGEEKLGTTTFMASSAPIATSPVLRLGYIQVTMLQDTQNRFSFARWNEILEFTFWWN